MEILGIGPMELIVVLIIALMVFGPDKLPEIGAKLGKSMRSMREATKEFSREIEQARAEIEAPIKEVSAPLQEIGSAMQTVSHPQKALRDAVLGEINRADQAARLPAPATVTEKEISPALAPAPENVQPDGDGATDASTPAVSTTPDAGALLPVVAAASVLPVPADGVQPLDDPSIIISHDAAAPGAALVAADTVTGSDGDVSGDVIAASDAVVARAIAPHAAGPGAETPDLASEALPQPIAAEEGAWVNLDAGADVLPPPLLFEDQASAAEVADTLAAEMAGAATEDEVEPPGARTAADEEQPAQPESGANGVEAAADDASPAQPEADALSASPEATDPGVPVQPVAEE